MIRINGAALVLALAALAGAAEVAPATSNDEPLAKRLLEHEYHRLPPSALQAMAQRLAGTGEEDEVERFATDLQAGAWQAMRATLDTLTPEESGQVYDRVLQQLVEHNGVLLPGEVIDLAEVAPGELSDLRLALLGHILKNSVGLVSATGSLVARLEAGTAQFGGRDPAHRGRAAALLLAAERVVEAGAFLPSLAAALAAQDDATLDLHARFLTAIGRERKQPAELLKAWNLSTTILQRAAALPILVEVRSRAVARCLALLSAIPPATGDAWLRLIFATRPDVGQALLAETAAEVTRSLDAKQEDQRRAALNMQHRVVSLLLAVAGSERWRSSLDLLSLGWLNEASLALQGEAEDNDADSGVERYIRQQLKQYNPQPNQMQAYRQHFRNQYFQSRGGNRRHNSNEVQPLTVVDLLASAPTPAWLALLDSSLAQRLRSMVGEFVCRGGDRDRALALIQDLAKDEPQRAAHLARSLVRAFSRSLVVEEEGNDRNNSRAGSGIPLTRARQTRNLAHLAALLARLSELPVQPVQPADVVQAFVACHSPAEVFRAEDIASVLGDPQALPAGVLVALVSAMRERLADAWRKPSVQQEAGTQRSDAEVVAEVERGYGVAKALCAQSLLVVDPFAWRLILVKATLDFDHGEFAYGQQAPLATYAGLRDAAFAGYDEAARTYSLTLTGEQPLEVTVYMRWFAAALGASDLSYLSRQQEADGDQVAAVRDALSALPGPLAEAHRHLFARQVVESLGDIHAELKPRYLRHALRIIGDSPLAAQVQALVDDYAELLGEVQLDLSVDGATVVGHGVPFGARLSLRHTTALGRESGGFSKYLQNQAQSSSGEQVNYRNDLEKHLRETLGERFSVESITFHAEDVASHGYGRDGWRELPLAYLVLKAKDASVDRLPSVHLDLDFVDTHGAVILPVSSGVSLIDARTTPAPRTAEVTGVELTLDDRELSAGTLILEVRASGKGLIGGLETLLDPTVAGFGVAEVDDRGPTVSSMEVAGSLVRPLCERVWQVRYTPGAGPIPSSFAFPTVSAATVAVKRQRYHDADLLDAAEVESLTPRQPWSVRLRPWLGAATAALAILVVIWLVRRARQSRRPTGPRHVLPQQLTPFSVLAVLKALHGDGGSGLDEGRRTRLDGVITDLEQRSFARAGQAPTAVELGTIAREWVA